MEDRIELGTKVDDRTSARKGEVINIFFKMTDGPELEWVPMLDVDYGEALPTRYTYNELYEKLRIGELTISN